MITTAAGNARAKEGQAKGLARSARARAAAGVSRVHHRINH